MSKPDIQEKSNGEPSQSAFKRQTQKVTNFFSVPAPFKALFDRVPVLTYPPNALPQRSPKSSRIPRLYVFITDADAAAGRPSFNPSCLKWQVSGV
jgi:metaxin